MPENTESEYKDLFDVLNEETLEEADFLDASRYWVWEDNVATPALEKLGWSVTCWEMGEYDSFGPLSRIACCRHKETGETAAFIYS